MIDVVLISVGIHVDLLAAAVEQVVNLFLSVTVV
jgi:hypothetical protein